MERDNEYYFHGNYVVLKVENRLFRIPQSYLVKHIEFFEDLFASSPHILRPCKVREGWSDTNPMIVSSEITVKDFRSFIQVLLPLRPWKPIDLSTDEWISVLKVSTLWRCLELRALAIEKITKKLAYSLSPTNLVLLGRKYFVADWVIRGYERLINVKEELSGSDGEEIGWEEAFLIMSLRATRQSTANNNPPRDITNDEIRNTFRIELEAITAAAAPYAFVPESRNSYFFPSHQSSQ